MIKSNKNNKTINVTVDKTTLGDIRYNTRLKLFQLTIDRFSGMSCELQNNDPKTKITLLRKNNNRREIIAWSLMDCYDKCQIFVAHKYRKLGLGSLLANEFLEYTREQCSGYYVHDKVSGAFWDDFFSKNKDKKESLKKVHYY